MDGRKGGGMWFGTFGEVAGKQRGSGIKAGCESLIYVHLSYPLKGIVGDDRQDDRVKLVNY
jgi:hypothetical protein